MIYIETKSEFPNELDSGLGIDTNLSSHVEVALAQAIFNHLEKVFVGTKCDNSCKNFKMSFLGGEFKSAVVGMDFDDDPFVDVNLIHTIMAFLNSICVEMANDDLCEEFEDLELKFRMSNLGFLHQFGKLVTIIVD